MSNPLPFVTAENLGTYLGSAVDEDRAELLIKQAELLCESVVTPLPAGASAVILDVAGRAYSNPTSVPAQAAGPFNVSGAPGGLWLTRQNKQTLRRLAGSGGAFTIETLPVTAGQNLPWWDRNGIGGEFSTEWGGW
jgi:hypothetical protein